MSETHSIRITYPDGCYPFVSYLAHRGRTAWSRRQAQRHVREAKNLLHFQGCTFHIEEN